MALGDVAGLLEPVITASQTYGDALVPLGRTLLALSLVLALLGGVYRWWLGEASGAIARGVRAALIFTIPFYLLSGNNWTASTGALAGFFQSEITTPLLARGGGGAGGSGPDLVKNMITKVANSAWPDPPQEEKKSLWQKTQEFLANPSFSPIEGIYNALQDFLLKALITVVAMLLVVSLLFALYAPLLMLQIGVILGPVLIAWLPFEPLADLSRQWLRFMITSGMSLVVGVLMALICSSAIDSYAQSIVALSADPDMPFYLAGLAKIGGLLATAGTMVFMSVMMFKADNIASALVGGTTAGGGAGAVIIGVVQRMGGKPGPQSQPKK